MILAVASVGGVTLRYSVTSGSRVVSISRPPHRPSDSGGRRLLRCPQRTMLKVYVRVSVSESSLLRFMLLILWKKAYYHLGL